MAQGSADLNNIYRAEVDSPLGILRIVTDEHALLQVRFTDEDPETFEKAMVVGSRPAILQDTLRQLGEYFAGRRRVFDLALAPKGTDFQQRTWAALTGIPFGKTITYLDLARRLGDELSIRAAASANGKNPIAIIIPCHRVIGSNGDLTGYAGGLPRKKFLLELEAQAAHGVQSLF
jgi:methylated-DNA-[protein]-cysteine S-methyltransferase